MLSKTSEVERTQAELAEHVANLKREKERKIKLIAEFDA